jgi:hypothetical protein
MAGRRPRVLASTADMALPRTFVSFSSTHIRHYRLMCAWKAHEHIDFDFADFQLDEAINSENPYYIKSSAERRFAAPRRSFYSSEMTRGRRPRSSNPK